MARADLNKEPPGGFGAEHQGALWRDALGANQPLSLVFLTAYIAVDDRAQVP